MRGVGIIAWAVFVLVSPALQAEAQRNLPSIDFAQLLAPPSAAEIRQVEEEISRRTYFPESIEVVAVRRFVLDAHVFDARFIEHRIDGYVHCGVALVPTGAAPGSLPGMTDVPGVAWDFPTRNLSQLQSPARWVLGDRLSEFVILEPCLRGSGLELAGVRMQAEGDRRDAWDGAATDAIAFTYAAASVVPELDFSRLVIVGGSRGGAVSLLAASRTTIFKAAVAFAGPMDFFREMNMSSNWADDLRAAHENRQPQTYANQQLEFLVDGREQFPIARLRARLIASSPVYFAARLPPTQVHQGRDDPHVPARNAERMEQAFQRSFGASRSHQVFIHENAGHGLGTIEAAVAPARAFLIAAVSPANADRRR